MNSISYINQTIWWVVSENKHYGVLEVGQTVSSRYNFIVFDNESDWQTKLVELGITYKEPTVLDTE